MRGRTLKNCFAILDDINATSAKIKMFPPTRIGDNSKLVVNGDPTTDVLSFPFMKKVN